MARYRQFSINRRNDVSSYVSTLARAGLALTLALAMGACTDSTEESAAESPALAAPAAAGMVRGTVLETMDAAGYTYTLIQLEDENRWVASQPAKVQVGDVVQTTEGMAMAGFHSKALNRTFDTVYFVETLQNLSSETLPDGHPETALPSGHPDVAEPETTEDVKTAVAQLEPGQDIAWLYANKDSLNGQPIRLRGKVVKYNDGILGQNFIHIQDGSGSAASGNNDLTITTQNETAVGEIIVVSGTVVLDKDFGAGYSFPVLVEDATISKE
jgi:hypothetical protein